MKRAGGALVALVLLDGCLFRGAEAPRFFRPGSAILATAADPEPDRSAAGTAIRLRAVRAEPFLRERVVWRASAVEYGLYEQRRWLDLPAHYVDQALRTKLRETPGLRLTDDARAIALRVDVLAFDEVLAPTHAAVVTLAAVLDDPGRGRLLERTFYARAAIAGEDPASMAQAMGQALDDAVAQVAEAVQASVVARRTGRAP